jgi:DNA-binding cell septation regulator SpoVG
MNITKVQIHLNHGTTSRVKAWVDIIQDGEFIVKGLAIREDAKESYHFVTMPYKMRVTNHDEVRDDIAHPINESCRKYIEDTVLDEYELVLSKIANDHEGRKPTWPIDRDRGRYATQ